MYPKNLEEILILSLDMNLGIIDDKSKIKENIENTSIIHVYCTIIHNSQHVETT